MYKKEAVSKAGDSLFFFRGGNGNDFRLRDSLGIHFSLKDNLFFWKDLDHMHCMKCLPAQNKPKTLFNFGKFFPPEGYFVVVLPGPMLYG